MKLFAVLQRMLIAGAMSVSLSGLSMLAHAEEWAGLYLGKVSGQPSQLTLNRAGVDVIGVLDTEGYRYKVEGNLQDGKLIGFCRDIKTGKTGQLSAVSTDRAIIIRVILPGFHRPARLVFERAENSHRIFTKIAMR
ncbi:hypothetical protein [Litoribrevibacter albus]|uniref:Uncharacterized protein n=1 Tax=Litoribrevibacter albus TaxID=1473156 RepID=A0AA37S9M8_9GAMM|nr:hypothetical protein [Litoribrevibacter albus]GLQ31785.1 hypothetical protein GCM10007876_22640 [Litoribrevibacter albus]